MANKQEVLELLREKKVQWYHECQYCHGRAWGYKEKPIIGEAILTSNIIYFDRPNPKLGDKIICQSCGSNLQMIFFKDIKEDDHGRCYY
jgi:hypothetical protein